MQTNDSGRLRLAGLTLAALGVVYGDIGTSPLYALRECFDGPHALPVTPGSVLGVLSLFVWSLLLIVSIKYIMFVMRADNKGEGGILALLSLAFPERRGMDEGKAWIPKAMVALGLFGAALLYGDGMITPAVSVLGAVEGLNVLAPKLKDAVVPITLVILTGLFMAQRAGTGAVGRVFGPIMIVWFGTLVYFFGSPIGAMPMVLTALTAPLILRELVVVAVLPDPDGGRDP